MTRLLTLSILCFALAACGVKPSEPAPQDPRSGFPHTYPDPATDPASKMIK